MPIVVLTVILLIFYQPLGNNEAKKLIDLLTFYLIYSTSSVSTPTDYASHAFFLTLSLIVHNNSLNFSSTVSFSDIGTGNFPIEVTCLPISLVTFLESDSDTKRTSNFLAHFLISFDSLLNFLRSSTLSASILSALAYSICAITPITHTDNFDLHG